MYIHGAGFPPPKYTARTAPSQKQLEKIKKYLLRILFAVVVSLLRFSLVVV